MDSPTVSLGQRALLSPLGHRVPDFVVYLLRVLPDLMAELSFVIPETCHLTHVRVPGWVRAPLCTHAHIQLNKLVN